MRLYREKVTAIMHDLARAGDLLLLGRGGQIVLAEYPYTLHVRVIAPRAVRIQRVQELGGLSLEAATARVDASDRARASYLRRYFGLRSHAAELYDLVLNTARLSIEAAVDLICLAAERMAASKETDRS
jgi:cytidylate kinase